MMNNWKYIKIFVSSTFLDMDVERDALKNIVEPRLNEFLKSYACSLEFIDLRHSVKTTSTMTLIEREKQIFNICLEEIDNCKPYFMGIIGHRYGWIPSEDKVPCPKVYIPEDFPIEEQNLSVTMYEFLQGIFNPLCSKDRTIIFVRSENSYKEISSNEDNFLIEQDDKLKYLKDFREFILSNDNKYNVVEYTLPISPVDHSSLLDWTYLVYDKIKELIKDDFLQYSEIDEYRVYNILQESYVQNHICNFCGRELEIKSCLQMIKNENCFITAKERGLGLSTFFCKIYDLIRQDKKNICLLYCEDADLLISISDAMINWLIQLDYIEGGKKRQQILEARGNTELISDIWLDLTDTLLDKGYNIYLFCETFSSLQKIDYVDLDDISIITTIYYTDNMYVARSMLFLIDKLDVTSKLHIVKGFRDDVKSTFMACPYSSNVKWLTYATRIVDNLNKFDFSLIRNRHETDKEERISKYQIEIINELPSRIDEMIDYYIKRLKKIFNSAFVDDYLFLMSLNSSGWDEKFISNILNCNLIEITTLRQMLGNDIIKQTRNGLWAYSNSGLEMILSKNYDLRNFQTLINNVILQIRNNSYYDPIYEKILFKMSMLNGDVECCSYYIENNKYYLSDYCNLFLWYANRYKLDYLNFIYKITIQQQTRSRQFFYNLLQIVKRLWTNDTIDLYIASIERIISSLKNMWIKKEIDLNTYSVICDALACKGNYLQYEEKIKEMIDCIDYGILICKEYYKEDPAFLVYYPYFLLIKKGCINDNNTKYSWLNKMFILLENQNEFRYPSSYDFSSYALLIHETAKVMVETGHIEGAETYFLKALNLLLDFLRGQEIDKIETILSPVDTKRNLVIALSDTLKYYIHYRCLTLDQLSPICNKIIEKCKDFRILTNTDAYIYYHKVKVLCIYLQKCDVQDKAIQILNLIKQIENNYDDDNELSMLLFPDIERHEKDVKAKFAAWFYANSIYMYMLSMLPYGKIILPRMEGSEFRLIFDSNLKYILRLVGVKKFDEQGLPNKNIWDSLIILYISMINMEMNKEKKNLQYIVKLYNSCMDIITAITNQGGAIPISDFIKILSAIKIIIEKEKNNIKEEKIDYKARYTEIVNSFDLLDKLFAQDFDWANDIFD